MAWSLGVGVILGPHYRGERLNEVRLSGNVSHTPAEPILVLHPDTPPPCLMAMVVVDATICLFIIMCHFTYVL